MTTKSKWNLVATVLFIGIILSLMIGLFPKPAKASAEANYYSAEKYTESDQLLQEDGSRSEHRNISDFATDVKLGNNTQAFPELAQVVPLEYLESTEENAEFRDFCKYLYGIRRKL